MEDAFLSYSTEDTATAKTIAHELRFRGFDTWFAPVSLSVGDKLLDAIERGMEDAHAAILLVSPSYLERGWTNFEMDALLRLHVERKMRLLPVWVGVSKAEVARRHVGLAGIVATMFNAEGDLASVVSSLVGALSGNAPTICVIPSWESPKHRFLQGIGEVKLRTEDGLAASMWELLLHLSETEYPLHLDGERFSREDLLLRAFENLNPQKDAVIGYVGEGGYAAIHAMFMARGLNPDLF
jgi:hypothetical protein